MDLDKMIQNLLKEDKQNINNLDEPPSWAKEIIKEIKEIKSLLKKSNYKKTNYKKEYYSFVNNLRKKLKSDVKDNKHPKIYYNNKYYGISEEGLLYNMHTLNNLSTYKAFEIFEFLYKNKNNLDKYIYTD